MIGFGSTEIAKAYLGGTEISKMYLGNELVFGGEESSITILENVGLRCVSAYIELPDLGLSNVGISVDGKFNSITNSNSNCIAMRGSWYNNQNPFRLITYSNKFQVYHFSQYIDSGIASDTSRHTFELRGGNFIIDSTVVNTYDFDIPTHTRATQDYYINIGSYHSRTNKSSGSNHTIYSVRIYNDSDVLVSDYRPAYSSVEDKYLLYDIVRKYELYPASGTLEIDE